MKLSIRVARIIFHELKTYRIYHCNRAELNNAERKHWGLGQEQSDALDIPDEVLRKLFIFSERHPRPSE